MSSLSSSSTLDEIRAAYADNASYAEDGDAAKARAFVTACRILLLRLPKRSGEGENFIEMSPELIHQEMTDARQWLAANEASGSSGSTSFPRVTRADLRNFRG